MLIILRPYFTGENIKLACILVLGTSGSYNYELALYILTIKSKKYHFLLNFAAFFQQSASPLYYALVDELHDNFETINAGKQELDSLNFALL